MGSATRCTSDDNCWPYDLMGPYDSVVYDDEIDGIERVLGLIIILI